MKPACRRTALVLSRVGEFLSGRLSAWERVAFALDLHSLERDCTRARRAVPTLSEDPKRILYEIAASRDGRRWCLKRIERRAM